MPQLIRIDYIKKTDKFDEIEKIGGNNSDGTIRCMKQEEAIQKIKERVYSFYVIRNGYVVNVIISKRNGNEYLKTENDGDWNNNLLSLPQCPNS